MLLRKMMFSPISGDQTEQRVQAIVRRLRELGHRVTPQRLAILRTFVADTGHPSAEQIFRRLHRQFPTMAVSTVYNTLALLVRLGEAVEVSPATPEGRFDPRVGDHCHLICLECKKIVDVPCSEEVDWAQPAHSAAEHGFEVIRQVHEVYGLCPECQKKQGGGDALEG